MTKKPKPTQSTRTRTYERKTAKVMNDLRKRDPAELTPNLGAQDGAPPSKSYEQKTDKPVAITPIEYGGLQAAFDHLNVVLFGGTLPDLFIIYSRRARSGGHYSPKRYAGRDSDLQRDELSLNPDSFIGKSDEWIVSMLLHEMAHHWQEYFGTQRRANYAYHDKEWAAKMKSLGLMPSNNGMVGGKETGQRMSHYVVPGGPFARAFAELAATGWKLNLQSAIHAGGTKKPDDSKTRFVCLSCDWIVWGKRDTQVGCKRCGYKDMVPECKAVQSYEQEAALDGPEAEASWAADRGVAALNALLR